jgi:hypothetical protein
MTDRGTLQDQVDDLLEETSRLYDRVHSLEAQLDRANQRAEYWSQMFDTLNDDLNNRLKDDDDE